MAYVDARRRGPSRIAVDEALVEALTRAANDPVLSFGSIWIRKRGQVREAGDLPTAHP